MAQKKNRFRIFKNDRAREWATDFMIGIAMFVLVAIFASTNTDSALPAPLARTEAVLLQNAPATTLKSVQSMRSMQFVSSRDLNRKIDASSTGKSPDQTMMMFVALAFSALMTLTIQFWRNLRRAYASPRRKWGKG